MQLYFLQALLLLASCQGNSPASYDHSGTSATGRQAPLPADIDTRLISELEARLEQSVIMADQAGLIAAMDSLIAIMRATPNLFQKGNIAQYLMNMATGEVTIENAAGQIDGAELSQRILTALSDQDGLCKRLQHFLAVADGQLLGITGSETATIALLTHCRSLYLGYASIGKKRSINWEDCRKGPDNEELQSYFSQHCQ